MTMTFQPFLMERWQSLYEHEVEFNLADSAVRCAPLSFLLDADELAELAARELFYPPVDGTPELRTRIASTYTPAPSPDEVPWRSTALRCSHADRCAAPASVTPVQANETVSSSGSARRTPSP